MHAADRENIAELRANAENARPEASKDRMSTFVIGDLLIGISDKTNKGLLERNFDAPQSKWRSTPLNLRIRVLEIIGDAGDGREFMSRQRIEIGVAAAAIDGPVTNAHVGKAVRIISPDRNIARRVGHIVVDAIIPLQCDHRVEVAEPDDRVRYASRTGGREGTKPRRQRAIQGRAVPAEYSGNADSQLAAQHRCRESICRS